MIIKQNFNYLGIFPVHSGKIEKIITYLNSSEKDVEIMNNQSLFQSKFQNVKK